MGLLYLAQSFFVPNSEEFTTMTLTRKIYVPFVNLDVGHVQSL